MNAYERVKAYLVRSPEASVREIADALMMSPSTAHKWHNRVKEAQEVSEPTLIGLWPQHTESSLLRPSKLGEF